MKHAFSLVELSIVLVILGLLTGGILTGQNLIRAAELRSVATEFANHQTAVNQFRDKYFVTPGDMNNAIDFWGSAGGSGSIGDGCEAATGTGTQTCNGDGDGILEGAGDVSEYGERFTFWQHMANAGLIEGNYTGIAGPGDRAQHIIGENAPKSKISNVTWSAEEWGVASGLSGRFDGTYGHCIYVGEPRLTGGVNNPFLLPEEAWGIDKKVDDGQPALGKVVVRNRVDCAIKADGSALTTAGADAAELDSTYNLSSSGSDCSLVFREVW